MKGGKTGAQKETILLKGVHNYHKKDWKSQQKITLKPGISTLKDDNSFGLVSSLSSLWGLAYNGR